MGFIRVGEHGSASQWSPNNVFTDLEKSQPLKFWYESAKSFQIRAVLH